ncbi:MAG: universal stress protein [Anaerolineaceae bacterium]|nr:universal stress protein [Anaerolineaceae bacterium]
MIRKIVALLDGSTLAQGVLPHTWALAHVFQAEVTLLRVLEQEKKTDTGRLDPINWHLRKIAAQSFLDEVSKETADDQIAAKTVLLEGAAANRIIEYIEEAEPDLIMLSSHGQGGLSPWNISSVAQKIINRAFSSFMLVRAYHAPDMTHAQAQYHRIAVPLDGSKRAECVLPFASQLAAMHNAELLLIHAQVPPTVLQSHTLTPEETAVIEQLETRNRTKAERYLAQMAEQLEPDTKIHHLSGANTADVLLEFTDANEVDLVMMSAHGYASETVRPYGSIVSSFIAYGSTPLFIIQDLTPDQIKPTKAELSAIANGNTGRTNRTNAYAQPADWSSQ